MVILHSEWPYLVAVMFQFGKDDRKSLETGHRGAPQKTFLVSSPWGEA